MTRLRRGKMSSPRVINPGSSRASCFTMAGEHRVVFAAKISDRHRRQRQEITACCAFISDGKNADLPFWLTDAQLSRRLYDEDRAASALPHLRRHGCRLARQYDCFHISRRRRRCSYARSEPTELSPASRHATSHRIKQSSRRAGRR